MEPALSHRPRFRQDLIAELIDEAGDSGSRFIDVMDPDSGHVFRFFEVEYSLACAMDGERDVSGIVQWAKEELGLSPSTREVQAVIAALRDLGYLEGAAAQVPAVAEAAKVAEVPSAEASISKERAKKPTAPPEPARPAAAQRAADAIYASAQGDRAATIPDLELGHARSQLSHSDTSMGAAADIELGSGVTTAQHDRDADLPAVEDIALGHSGRADVGDLSHQVGVSVADVKDAVRASQRLPAVDPEAASIELAESRPSERPKTHPTRPQPAPRVARTSDRSRQPETQPGDTTADQSALVGEMPGVQGAAASARDRAATADERMHDRSADTVAERPPEPSAPVRPSWRELERASRQIPAVSRSAGTSDQPDKPAPRAPVDLPKEPRVSRAVVALLALLVVACVGYVAYKVALKKPDPQPSSASVTPEPEIAARPAAPSVEVRQLGTSAEKTESIKPAGSGVIESIQEGAVKTGDIIVRFAGRKRLDAEVAALQRDLEKRLQPELAQAQRDRGAAQASGNAAKLAETEKRVIDRQKSVAERQAKLALKQAELEKHVLRAPFDGRVVAKALPGAKVNPADEIAQLLRTSFRIATFKNAAGTPKTRVLLTSLASGRKLSCVVAAVDATGTTIECPLDVAPEGAEVTFGGIDASTPETSETSEIEIEPPAAGSPPTGNVGADPAKSGAAPNAAPASSGQGSQVDPATPVNSGVATPVGSGGSPEPQVPSPDKPAAVPADKPGGPADKPNATPADKSAGAAEKPGAAPTEAAPPAPGSGAAQ